MTTSRSAQIRAEIDHPVIDADGHFVELAPVLDDALLASLEAEGGSVLRDRYLAGRQSPFDTSTVLAGRARAAAWEAWTAMPSWWGWQTANSRDRATSHLPALLYERLDEMGIDFSILYPSTTLGLIDIDDPELAGPVARAVNSWLAELFRPYADRLTVGAIIPMTTPEVAVAEMRHAVSELGFKTVVISGYAKRYLGNSSAGPSYRLDHFGIDSAYDYDPVWATCVELGVSPVSHSAHQHHRVSRSPSSYVYNHIGGLATAHESLAKSLFLGGVTRRFPTLQVGFLEGGVAWAASLFADLIGHWEKRNGQTIHDLDPDRLDVEELMVYLRRYGDESVLVRLDRIRQYLGRPAGRPDELNEFAATGIREVGEFHDLFVPRFYFGCEGDDPLVAWAFAEKVNPLGARFRPIFGSDISHWDVPDMTAPVAEAHELVERGAIGSEEFRELMFVNPVRLHAGANPHFFEGTVVAEAAATALTGDA